MHGIEHRDPERRTFRWFAPLWPFSTTPGSKLSSTPQRELQNGTGCS